MFQKVSNDIKTFDLDNVFPLNFFVKHSKTCFIGEIAPHGNLFPFSFKELPSSLREKSM